MVKTIHRAKYALVDPYTLIQNAAVAVSENGRIETVAPWRDLPGNAGFAAVDWDAAVILPGLVNAHAHLELPSLCNRLTRFDSFTDWLSQLIAKRRAWSHKEVESSIMKGVALSLSSGTTMVGDISSSGSTRNTTCGSLLRRVIFEESISFSPERADENISEIQRTLSEEKTGDLDLQGISPHAPYSVSEKLYRGLADLAQRRNLPLATHAAETEAEIQFLQAGTGPFRDFLQDMGIFPSAWNPPGLLPIPYLHSLGISGRHCLLIHCNYLDRESIDLIVHSGSNIVYCPRSHAFFDHPKHPVRQLLDAGVNVALGTDSLASNTTLSMLDEMRFLYRKRKDLKSEEILQAATLNGARALNSDDSIGVLKPGHRADMTVLGLRENLKVGQAADQILEGEGTCIGTIVGGTVAWHEADRI